MRWLENRVPICKWAGGGTYPPFPRLFFRKPAGATDDSKDCKSLTREPSVYHT